MHPTPLPSRRALRRMLPLALACALVAPLHGQTASVTIDADAVVRDIPAGLGGVCAGTDFWNTYSPNYRAALVKARVGLVRSSGYPADSSAGVGSLEALDVRVAQVINAGATPLLIQCIESESNTTFKNALLRLDGTPYPPGDPTPINERVATNITFLVNRYKNPPFNLTTQYWEISNEPDLANVNYKVATTQEYIDFFTLAHNQLVASGVRGNVLLAGPVVSWDYGFGSFRDDIMEDFLAACSDQVDIVTRHVYGQIYSWESPANTPYNQLNSSVEMIHFDHTIGTSRGEKALLALMDSEGVPQSVGTGITEMNLFNDGVNIYNHTITQGLWFLLANHHNLYNPRSYAINGFQFDRFSHSLAFFNADRTPSFPYWATYIHGVLTGNQVLEQTSSNAHIVVTATKDDSYLYVRVVNRHNTDSYNTTVTITDAPPVTAPTRHRLTATEIPESGVATTHGTTFSESFAPMTATIFRFPRTDAPTPPAPPAPPTTVHFQTDFADEPAGMLTYDVGFTPVVTGGRLQVTDTVSYARSAVVLNGQPLPAATSRAQVRFGFQVMQPYVEGFVFGAYSANPGAVGDAGAALGYHGQANRLWGVKVDNSPDQLGVLSANTDSALQGWASQVIPPYSTLEMFMVIDYDGAAGTVRARLYEGTDDTGDLWAEVTNRLGVPATLPAGTVFGFTGATGNFRQATFIDDLAILTGGGFGGQEIILDNASPSGVTITGAWNASGYPATHYGINYQHDQNNSKGAKSVRFTPTLAGTGPRDVYMRWPAHPSWSDAVPVAIQHAGGTAEVEVDQKNDGNQWVHLGTWTFDGGTSGYVQINTTDTTQHVVADAVRFVDASSAFVLGEEAILDNADTEGVVITGAWNTSGYPATHYGINYQHDQNNTKGSKSVRFTPTLTGAGYRDVYMRWPAHPSWSDAVPVAIQHAGGTAEVEVDQKNDGSQWVKLGTWQFDDGTTGHVQINTTGTTQHVVADAVRFVNVATP